MDKKEEILAKIDPTLKFVSGRLPMVCGSYEAQSRKYFCTQDSTRRWWLWADCENAADYIYCGFEPELKVKSDGFGGRTLEFQRVSGGTISLLGPWHTNSESLLGHTRIDLSDRHWTFGVCALNKTYLPGLFNNEYHDIIHIDNDSGEIGQFSRIENLAQEYANILVQKVYFYSQSTTGSHAFFKEPTNG